MKETIKARWLNDLAFEAEVDGHKLYMDTSTGTWRKEHRTQTKTADDGSSGRLYRNGCGCNSEKNEGRILKNSLWKWKEMLSEDHPKRFEGMKIIYRVKGKDINRKNVEKAVNFPPQNIVGYRPITSKAFPITHEIIIEE